MENDAVSYRTQIGLFTQGDKNPCAVFMKVDCDNFSSGPSRAKFELQDKDGNSMGAVLIGDREMKRLVMQLLMSI